MRDGAGEKGRQSDKKHGAQSFAEVLIGVASKGSLQHKKVKVSPRIHWLVCIGFAERS